MRLDGLPALGLIVGCVLAAGVMLVLSVWAWPRERSVTGTRLPVIRGALSPTLAAAGVAAILGIVVGAITLALTSVVGLAVVLALAAASLPTFVAARTASKERLVMRTLWPDVVDSLVSALRAGASLPNAIGSLTALSPRLVKEPAAAFERDYRRTGNFDACLDNLKGVWADASADRIVETLRLARHVGGSDVTTILRTLGGYLRQESAIRQEVEARQGWIRTAARIGVAAPWIVLALLSTRPEAAAAFNSASGIVVIFVGLGVSVVAYRIMLAVGILPEPRRWFA
jgi:tight adherence protein B